MSIDDDYERLLKLINGFQLPSEDAVASFKELMVSSDRIICIGIGRSADNADIFSRFIRNLGYERVYGPEDIPYVLQPGDLTIAFSGSGFTTYTWETAKLAKEAGAKVLALTSNLEGPLAMLADLAIHIPGKAEAHNQDDYYPRQLLGVPYSPLTPMGTLYELRALFFALSFVGSLVDGATVEEHFNGLCTLVGAYRPEPNALEELYRFLPRPRCRADPWTGKTIVVGEGFSGVVGRFFVTRLRHCARLGEERECYYWRDRGSISVRESDLVLVISGSGERIPALMAEKARAKGSGVAALTSFPNSMLAHWSDVKIIIPGRFVQRVKGLRSSYLPRNPRESVFELRALLTLEAFIHNVAEREGITERDMCEKHSDFT